MHRADRRRLEHRELAQQLVADLSGTPGGMLLLNPQDRTFNLKGQLVGLPVRSPAAVVEAVQARVRVSVKYILNGHTGDSELTAQRRHLLAFEQTGYET
jgi:hypothetical protein